MKRSATSEILPGKNETCFLLFFIYYKMERQLLLRRLPFVILTFSFFLDHKTIGETQMEEKNYLNRSLKLG